MRGLAAVVPVGRGGGFEGGENECFVLLLNFVILAARY